MSIRLVNGCVNCQNLAAGHECTVHHTIVEDKHTCDSFDMRVSLKDELDCMNCVKFNTENCPHPAHAAADMMCNAWAPKATA